MEMEREISKPKLLPKKSLNVMTRLTTCAIKLIEQTGAE
jgi:hypothetical protein